MYVMQKKSSGEVNVTYNFTHTNHIPGPKEFKHLPLPLSVQKEIERKFSQGITLERIINGMTIYSCN
jgi:hypothetical protein